MINKGDLLISTPESLGDYYFNRSIIILTEVSDEEVVGFIINKELNYTLNDLDNKVLEKGIKIFSDWPTIPQLYIKKEFVGGCDIVKEMYENGELKKILEEKSIAFKK